MGKLTCGCLNVKIFTSAAALTPVTDIAKLGVDVRCSEEFFRQSICHAQLSIEGMQIEQPCLLQCRDDSSGWRLHRCHGCGQWTHATHAPNTDGHILVSADLQSDPAAIESLSKSVDFSPLYQILIFEGRGSTMRTIGIETAKYESLQRALTTIQQRLNKFLASEEAALELRIRSYEAAQRASYAELESKARRDKNALIGLLLAAENSGAAWRPADAPPSPSSSPPSTGAADETRGVATGASPVCAGDTLPRMSLKKKHLSSSSSCEDRPKSRHVCRHAMSSSPDADGLFDLDPAFADDTNRPFYESEDDTEDTDDSSVDETDGRHWRRQAYSTSVPILVPLWKSAAHAELAGDDAPVPEPENMAASIKALAKSVHGATNELFGDLPRPPRPVTRPELAKH